MQSSDPKLLFGMEWIRIDSSTRDVCVTIPLLSSYSLYLTRTEDRRDPQKHSFSHVCEHENWKYYLLGQRTGVAERTQTTHLCKYSSKGLGARQEMLRELSNYYTPPSPSRIG